MGKRKVYISKKKGLPPGTPVFVGEVKVEETTLSLFKYNKKEYQLSRLSVDEVSALDIKNQDVHWLNIHGLHETEIIKKIGIKWNIPDLIIEDIVNTDHRPKIEFFDEFIFLITKMYFYQPSKKSILIEQVSFILSENTVISFQERPGDIFGPIRDRIKLDSNRIRKMGADYLLYSLIDCMVDNYLALLEKVGDDLDQYEEDIFLDTTRHSLSNFFNLKRSLLLLRKSVWPLRDMISQLCKVDVPLIKKSTKPFLQDLYEHVIHVVESVETYRDLVGGLTDMYMSVVNHKMNEVMKVLTVCASIFIPLTFLAGVYGMNFEYMPELKMKNGYFVILAVMGATAVVMLLYFKRKKWL